MLIVNGDRYRMAVQPGGPRPGAPAALARQYPHDEVVPRGGNGLTAAARALSRSVDWHLRPALTGGSGRRIGGISARPGDKFFEGLDLVEPGVISTHRWRPGPDEPDTEHDWPVRCGVARKR
jgi:hypothetical protein